jgi:hypothetical protein
LAGFYAETQHRSAVLSLLDLRGNTEPLDK